MSCKVQWNGCLGRCPAELELGDAASQSLPPEEATVPRSSLPDIVLTCGKRRDREAAFLTALTRLHSVRRLFQCREVSKKRCRLWRGTSYSATSKGNKATPTGTVRKARVWKMTQDKPLFSASKPLENELEGNCRNLNTCELSHNIREMLLIWNDSNIVTRCIIQDEMIF